jgi:hypothetical protein
LPGFEMLVQAGFDESCARLLAARCSAETIQRQIDWLSLRTTDRNRLGLLRRAIEQDWPKPGGSPDAQDPGLELGAVFARHYYAAYHGNPGEPATEPFAKETRMAAKYVQRLLVLSQDEHRVPEWGQRFGRLMRDKHQANAKAKPNLSFALVLYGDEFLCRLRAKTVAQQAQHLGQAKASHQAAFWPSYHQYLREQEKTVAASFPALYADFLEQRRRIRQAMSGGLFLASADTLARFDSEESRLEGFADHFQAHPQSRVLSFWEWDAGQNPHRFAALSPP